MTVSTGTLFKDLYRVYVVLGDNFLKDKRFFIEVLVIDGDQLGSAPILWEKSWMDYDLLLAEPEEWL